MLGGIGEVVGDISGNRDNFISEAAEGIIDRNPSGINSLQDVADKPGLAIAEGTANALSFLVPYMGAARALKLVNAGRGLATATQIGLGGIPSLGEIGESQRETGSENLALKYGGAGAVGAIENLFGLQRALGGMAGMPVREMSEEAARRLAGGGVKGFAKEWAKIGGTEGLEEVVQTPIEQYAGGKPLDTPAALEETALGGVLGAIGGLALGPLGAFASRSGASKFVNQIDTARDTLNTPAPAEFDGLMPWVQERESALDFLKRVTANDFGLQQAEAMAKQAAGQEKTLLDEAADTIAKQEYSASVDAAMEIGKQQQAEFDKRREAERKQELEERDARLNEEASARDTAIAFAKLEAEQANKPIETNQSVFADLAELLPAIVPEMSFSNPVLSEGVQGKMSFGPAARPAVVTDAEIQQLADLQQAQALQQQAIAPIVDLGQDITYPVKTPPADSPLEQLISQLGVNFPSQQLSLDMPQIEGPVMPAQPQFDEQDRFRAGLNLIPTQQDVAAAQAAERNALMDMWDAPDAVQALAEYTQAEQALQDLQRLEADLRTVAAPKEAVVAGTRYAPVTPASAEAYEGLKTTPPTLQQVDTMRRAERVQPVVPGIEEPTPLITKAGEPAAKPKMTGMTMEEMQRDLDLRINDAVANKILPPEVAAPIKDTIASATTVPQIKAARLLFEEEVSRGAKRPDSPAPAQSSEEGSADVRGGMGTAGAGGVSSNAGVGTPPPGGTDTSVQRAEPMGAAPAPDVTPPKGAENVKPTEISPDVETKISESEDAVRTETPVVEGEVAQTAEVTEDEVITPAMAVAIDAEEAVDTAKQNLERLVASNAKPRTLAKARVQLKVAEEAAARANNALIEGDQNGQILQDETPAPQIGATDVTAPTEALKSEQTKTPIQEPAATVTERVAPNPLTKLIPKGLSDDRTEVVAVLDKILKSPDAPQSVKDQAENYLDLIYEAKPGAVDDEVNDARVWLTDTVATYRKATKVRTQGTVASVPKRQGLAGQLNVGTTIEGTATVVEDAPSVKLLTVKAAQKHLTKAQQALINLHYGDKSSAKNTKSFLGDYANWLNDKKAYAKHYLRKVLEAFHRAATNAVNSLVAVATAFNFNVAQPVPDVQAASLPEIRYEVSQTVKLDSVDLQGLAARQDVVDVANWRLRAGIEKPFMVVDKVGGLTYAFDANGVLLAKTPALYGKSGLDTMTSESENRQVSEMVDSDKITPAGVFAAEGVDSLAYGKAVRFKQQASGDLLIHTVYLGNPSENRLGRLASATSADNRISYGCVNVPMDFAKDVLAKHFSGSSEVLVLPEQASMAETFPTMGDQSQDTRTVTTERVLPGGKTDSATMGNRPGDTLGRPEKTKQRKQARKSRNTSDGPKTTPQRIAQALREWFITPEQAKSKLTVVEKFSDLLADVQARVGEAQASQQWGDREDSPFKWGRESFLRKWYNRMNDVYDEGFSMDEAYDAVYEVASPQEQRVLRALKADDFLGFDYPHQAIKAIATEPNAYDISTELKTAISRIGNAQFSRNTSDIQAFVLDGKAYMIAENIPQGAERAVFMHEVGAHIGLTDEQTTQAAAKINEWANAKEGTIERQVYDATQSRMESAGETSNSELVAYATEEAVKAGVTPQATSAVGKFLQMVKNFYDSAIKKLFGTTRLTPQDLVDLTYGAAMKSMEVGAGKTAESIPQFSKSPATPYSVTSKQLPTAQQTQDMLAGAKTTMTDTVYNTALRHFATLGQVVDRAKAHAMKAPERFEEVVGKLRRYEKVWTDGTLPIAAWWQSLASKGDNSVRARFDTILRESEALALRVDKPLTDPANKWGANRKWGKDEKALWENEAQMKQMFGKLQREFNDLKRENPKTAENYTKIFDSGAKMIREYKDAAIAAVNRNITDPIDRRDIIAKIEKQWADAGAGRPWLPHRWYGQWKMEVMYKDGEREVVSFETKGQAELAQKALLDSGDVTEARYFRAEEFFANQKAFSRSALNDINSAIDKNLLTKENVSAADRKTAEALKRVVQESYFASMPETAGGHRLRQRKGTAGWERTDLARAWADSTTAMARMTAKMQHMDAMRDAVEDSRREAGERQGVYVFSWWDGKGDDRTNFRAKVIESADELAVERKKHSTENFHVSTIQPEEGLQGITSALSYAPDENVKKVITALLVSDMEKAAKNFKDSRKNSEEQDARSRISRALQSRYEDLLEADSNHPVSNALTTAGFVYYLGWTPAFAIMNVMQVPMITAPRLAAKFGGAMVAGGALKRAYALLGKNSDMLTKLMKASVSSAESDVVDIEDMRGLTKDQLKMLVEMRERGRLDFTQDTEMNSLTRGTPVFLQRIVKSATWLAHPTEVGNRIVTALATYELAKGKGMSEDAAYATVQSIIDETQMNYSPENRIALMNSPILRPMLQFKQFGQQMTYTLGKAIIQSFSKDPEVRREQQAFLGYIVASSFLLAGVKGLPFMGPMLGLFAAAMGDDDEPYDARYELENALGPLAANGLVGSYLSDWSRRVGLGDVFPVPIPGLQKDGALAVPSASRREKLQDIAFDAMGPTGSIAAGFAGALDAWDRGDATAALVSALPKAFRDPMRAAKIVSDEGMTTKDGIIRVGGENISIVDLIMISIGFKPSVEGRTMDKANYLYAAEKHAALRAALLVRQYDEANREGDDMSGIQAQIDKFNATNESHEITAARLKKFAAAKDNRQKYSDMMGGLGFSKQSRAMAEELGLLDSE
jgi:hypothetical protein